MQTRRLTIFGVASPYAWEVVEIATSLGWEPSALDNYGGADAALPQLHTAASDTEGEFALGLSSATGRARAAKAAFDAGLRNPVALAHPFTSIAQTATVKHGSLINAGAVVGSNVIIGCHAHVNRAASVGHNNSLGFAVSIGPGATLAGGVTVSPAASIGAGAVVLPGISIGVGATVGAGAVVASDVADWVVVVGNPARVLRTDSSDPNLGLTCPHC